MFEFQSVFQEQSMLLYAIAGLLVILIVIAGLIKGQLDGINDELRRQGRAAAPPPYRSPYSTGGHDV